MSNRAWLIIPLLLSGCGSQDPSPSAAEPTYLGDVRAVLTARCVPCHDDPQTRAPGGVVPTYFRLDSWDSDTDPSLTPCDAAGGGICGVEGMIATSDGAGHDLITRRAVIDRTMPPDGPLDEAERSLLERWAAGGHEKGTRAHNAAPTIDFVTPAAGDTQVTQPYDVTYDVADADGDTVIWDLRWVDDGGASGVLARGLGAGQGAVTVDMSALPSGTYHLEAVLVDGVLDAPEDQVCAGTLTVPAGQNAAPSVALTRPLGGELLRSTDSLTIEWTASDVDSPRLSGQLDAVRVSDGARTSLETLADLPLQGSFGWSLAGVSPADYRIELAVSDGTSTRTASSPSFTVQGPPQNVSFSTQVQPLLTQSCATTGCHDSATVANKQLRLSAGVAYTNLVGVASKECPATKRVDPGAPSTSYVVWKLQGSGPCFSGSKMPKGGSLTSAQITLVSDWIANGAPNN